MLPAVKYPLFPHLLSLISYNLIYTTTPRLHQQLHQIRLFDDYFIIKTILTTHQTTSSWLDVSTNHPFSSSALRLLSWLLSWLMVAHHLSWCTQANTPQPKQYNPTSDLMMLLAPNYTIIMDITDAFFLRRKRRKGSRQGRSQAPPQDSSWQHPRYYKACYQTSRASWWCQAYLSQ